MKTPVIALFSVFVACNAWIAPVAASDAVRLDLIPVVDLNLPGAMSAVARENPDHYVKIVQILAEVGRLPPETVPRWMNSEFGAEQVSYPSLLKTSDPAKRDLSFTLDRTRYDVTLQVSTRWSFATR